VRRIGEPVVVHLWLQLTEQIFPTPAQAVAQYWKHSFAVFVFGVCAFEVCAKVMPGQVMTQSNATAEVSLPIASLFRDHRTAAGTQCPTHTHDFDRRSHSVVQWFVAPNCLHSLLPGSVAYEG
jgi:hypothetical protein